MTKEVSPYIFTHVPKANKLERELLTDIERQMGGTLTENSLSSEQREVFDKICAWYDGKKSPLITLGGFAGTGKSTLVSALANKYRGSNIAYAAYTGKATSVLRRKFYEANVTLGTSEVKTLHSLMYYPVENPKTGAITGWRRRAALDCSFVIVDEASMLSNELFSDLQSYELPILAVGDHGQLPPVFGGSFSLMEKPMLRLETIHRQAENSPILALSKFVRQLGQIPRFANTLEVQVLGLDQLEDIIDSIYKTAGIRYADVGLLCYTNDERVYLNQAARIARWGKRFVAEPIVGDQVICLKNEAGTIFNGMRGEIVSLDPDYETLQHYYGKVLFEDDEIMVEGPINKAQFMRSRTFRDFEEYGDETGFSVRKWTDLGMLFDFGYALTVHKSQGSAFEHAVVVAQRPGIVSADDWKRWIYTAITRAEKYLAVVQ
jgi:exodeoxyribonuclease-5